MRQSKSAASFLQLAADQVFLEQLFAQPQRHRDRKGGKAARRKADIGFQKPLEFQERLFVEHDIVDITEADAGLRKAIGDAVFRKPRVMFLAGEALLLRRRDNARIEQERRGAVVIERGNPEDAHAACRFRTAYNIGAAPTSAAGA